MRLPTVGKLPSGCVVEESAATTSCPPRDLCDGRGCLGKQDYGYVDGSDRPPNGLRSVGGALPQGAATFQLAKTAESRIPARQWEGRHALCRTTSRTGGWFAVNQ